MPGPASTKYAALPTTIATAGPDRSGSALGVPVPRTTTRVLGTDAAGAKDARDAERAPRSAVVAMSVPLIARYRQELKPVAERSTQSPDGRGLLDGGTSLFMRM